MREESEHRFLLESTVNAALNGLLKHHRGSVGPKVIGKLLDLLPVQVGPSVRLLVDVDTDWKTQMRKMKERRNSRKT